MGDQGWSARHFLNACSLPQFDLASQILCTGRATIVTGSATLVTVTSRLPSRRRLRVSGDFLLFIMRATLLFSLMLNFLFLHQVAAQTQSITANPTLTTFISITPEMSSSSVASFFSALATSVPQQPGEGPSAGDVGSANDGSTADSDAGASGGGSDGGIELSRGGIIAIVVVVASIVLIGIASSILYWQAKKRSWQVRKTIRKSARRVATALTPRRSTFPKDIRNSRGLQKIDEVPPTPRRTDDVEKGSGNSKMHSFEMAEPPKNSKWGKKFGR
ncbi:hypothetical protein PVAG01_06242 [Phlyctema vagabunda]|uniref:Transmembrane protein n=1 Tax=Phlyctema vagabunda TaxID=108571 RepID=A0ABR4PFI4_9HELO